MTTDGTALAWVDLATLHRLIRSELGHALEAEAGIGLPETELLMRIASTPERRMRMCDLAERLAMGQSGITRLVDRVVEQGWVVRDQRPGDRRTIYAVLTTKGRVAEERVRPAYDRVVENRFGSLDPARRDDLRALLREVLAGSPVSCQEPEAD